MHPPGNDDERYLNQKRHDACEALRYTSVFDQGKRYENYYDQKERRTSNPFQGTRHGFHRGNKAT